MAIHYSATGTGCATKTGISKLGGATIQNDGPWIETEEADVEGVLSVVSVRNDAGVDGVRIRLEEGDREAFDAFYASLPADRSVDVIETGTGFVVFSNPGDIPLGLAWTRAGVALLDAAARAGLTSLTKEAITIDESGEPRFLPRYQDAPRHTPTPIAIGHFLRDQVPAGADPQLDLAIDALIDPVPEVQRTGRAHLLGEAPAAEGRTGEVKLTVVSKPYVSRGNLDRIESRAVVLILPSMLKQLEPTQRSLAAGLAGLPLSALDGLAAANLPLVLESHRRAWTARKAAELLSRRTGLPVTASTGAGAMGLLWSTALLTSTVATLLAATTFAMLGLTILSVLGGALTVSLGVMTGWFFTAWLGQRNLLSNARESEQEAHEERARRMGNPHLAAVWEALSAARAALAAAGLPAAPAADVRSVLKAAEQQVESLLRADEVARRGLSSTRPEDVRSRLAQLPDDTEPERRQRLEATLTELQQLEKQRSRITAESDRLAAVLAQVNEALSNWEMEEDGDGLDGVLRAAAEVRSSRHEGLQ